MFELLKIFHFRIARRLLNVRIGVRLFALMGLAAVVALVLTTAGIVGLSASKESLRSVYEDRMLPVQQLADIDNLMLNNRLMQQSALVEFSVRVGAGKRPALALDMEVAAMAADAIERNIATIDTIWQSYASSKLPPLERTLANRFAESRDAYINQALIPSIAALRAGQYGVTKTLASSAQVLYDEASTHLHVLNQRQFDAAQDAYAEGVRRYETTRLMALSTLGLAMLVMGWLGFMLTTSIVYPLEQVIAIFRKIAKGQYDSTIAVEGQDEISKVMLALQDMQDKLGVNEKSIHQLAFYDALTGLPNRRLLRDRLQRAMSVSTRNHLYGAVLMIDLDNFKSINDTRGHDVGDLLLVEIALRIQSCVRQSDTVSRLGGDEFIVLLVDLSPDEAHAAVQAEVVGEKILSLIDQHCMLFNQLYRPSASMGVCLFLGQNVSLEELHKRADMSMYQAKSNGRNTLRFYDPQVQASLEERIVLESELRNAVATNQLTLHYQIQVDNAHGVLGAEVLLRWECPGRGLVPPDQFIPIAEESGLILPIGEWVLRTACAQLKAWEANSVAENFLLSVNVSARQFRQPEFVAQVCQILAETGINPKKLKLELTESLVLHNVADTIDKMKALNLQGVHFSMDDFGTGYSSLAHLTALPIQQLKIDRSFVSNIASNHNDAVIVQTIIGMAYNLGVAVIAEGVESEEQRACLERFGCPTYQGYLYGKPMPLKEFEELAMQVSTT